MRRDDTVISLTVILSLRTSVSGHRVYLKHNFYLESNAKCPSVASLPARERTRVCVCVCMCAQAHLPPHVRALRSQRGLSES